VNIALFQPDIPQNAGTILRMAACLGVAVDIVEPAGFDVSDRKFRRSGMDYLEHVALRRFASWQSFIGWVRESGSRLVLATVRGAVVYTEFLFREADVILFGRESSGFADYVRKAADETIRIPMLPGMRSLNVAVSAAMIVGEALRQIRPMPALVPVTANT
jgi:tRNA (cytidine/uridine-2'-O-)-methyltransferase